MLQNNIIIVLQNRYVSKIYTMIFWCKFKYVTMLLGMYLYKTLAGDCLVGYVIENSLTYLLQSIWLHKIL